MDTASLAEETYCHLSDDVTCRASALRSLVLTSCSSDVIQLLTALCSQLLHLQLIDCTQVIVLLPNSSVVGSRCLASLVVRASDLRLSGRELYPRPPH